MYVSDKNEMARCVEYEGHMYKAVKQRNEFHSKLEKAKKQAAATNNRDQTGQTSVVTATTITTTSSVASSANTKNLSTSQVKNVMLVPSSQPATMAVNNNSVVSNGNSIGTVGHATNNITTTTVTIDNSHHQGIAATTTLNFTDSNGTTTTGIPIGVLDPSNAGNILQLANGQLTFTVDPRTFVQPGVQAAVQAMPNILNIVPQQGQEQQHVVTDTGQVQQVTPVTTYNQLLQQQTPGVTADLSSFMGGLFSGGMPI